MESFSQASSYDEEQRPQDTPLPTETNNMPDLTTLQPEDTDANVASALPSHQTGTRLNLDQHLASEETQNPAAIQPVELNPPLPINQEDVYNWSSHLRDQQSTPSNTFPAQRLQTLTQSVYKRDLHITYNSPSHIHQQLDKDAHQ